MRSDEANELVANSTMALVLAYIIAIRAKQGESFSVNGLQPGEAMIGDHAKCGMTRQQYRTAVAQLSKWGFATFRTTNKGTIAKLSDTRLFDTINNMNNQQTTSIQPSTNHQTTTKQPADSGQIASKSQADDEPVAVAGGAVKTVEQVAVEIYEAYPKKVAKAAGLRAIISALKNKKVEPEILLQRVKDYAEAMVGKETKYIKHPATWFNAESWDDDQAMWRNGYLIPETATMEGF